MKKIKTSAPGKLMLFGEHAVVYDYPCIVTSISPRVYVEIEGIKERSRIEAPQVKNTQFVERSIDIFNKKYHLSDNLLIRTYSDFSSQYGFGSSSAITVATIYALSKYYKVELTNKEIFELGFKVVKQVQGVGSGFDIAAAIYGGTLYFVTGGKVIEPLSIDKLPLIIGYSGIKADTSNLIKNLKADFNIFDNIKKIVESAKLNLVKGELEKTGELMSQNHMYLQQLGVSTKKLDNMCLAAISSGAYGAKLSGAGGGDCMIALAPLDKMKSVESAIINMGGEIIDVNNNSQGVKLENI